MNEQKEEIKREYELSEPLVTAEGQELKSISLDTKKLKAKDFLKLQSEFEQRFGRIGNLKLLQSDQRYHLMVVARINGLQYEDLEDGLNGDDFNAVSIGVMSFLLSRLA